MAVNSNETGYSAASRRWFFGTNLLVLVLLVVAVVAMVNYLGQRATVRRDMAGGFGGVQLSDRAKAVLGKVGGDLRLTTVYTSDEPETDRRKYFPKVQDLCREIGQVNRGIKIQHLFGGNERAELRDRVQNKFGSTAEKYNEIIKLSTETWASLSTTVEPVQKEIEALLQSDSWLSGFSTLANISAVLRKDSENLEQTRKEVDELVHGEGLPRYQEANTKIKSANDDLKKHLEDTQKWTQEMNKLAKVLSDPKLEFAVKTRAKIAELNKMVAELKKVAGNPNDTTVPDDPKPVLQEFAKAGNQLATWLSEEANRVDLFVREYPAIQRHPRWLMQVQVGVFPAEMPLSGLLADTSQALSQNTQRLRDILKRPAVAKDQVQSVTRQARAFAGQVEEQLNAWSSGITAILDEGVKLDPNSKDLQFLARGSRGDLFKPVLDKLSEISTKISSLPALKIDEIANRLQQDNIIVVENDKEVRVVTFDEVWPVADQDASRFGMRPEDEKNQRRVFTGDAAVTGAVLSMQSTKPIATVILTAYESDPPPQARQMGQRRNVGPVPLESLGALKEKLEQANFKVKEWNLGAEGEAAKAPDPEEGTEAIYVLLPPAPRQTPNFMMGTTTEKGFGEPELRKIRSVLDRGGKAMFLALYLPTGPGMPPMENPYTGYLADAWGIKLDPEYRVIRGVIDRRNPGHFSVNLMQWYYMQLSFFNRQQPVGAPLAARRVLMRDVCPMAATEKVPADVKVTSICEIPASAREYWAEKDINRIIQALRSPEGGSFTPSETESKRPPLPVMMAAENEKTKGRVIVLGSGMSFRDDYLNQRVMRIEGNRNRLVTDPPPSENADLFVNAMFWLSGRQDLIGAGPADVPVVPMIEDRAQKGLLLATGGWAVAVLLLGGVVMLVRRK